MNEREFCATHHRELEWVYAVRLEWVAAPHLKPSPELDRLIEAHRACGAATLKGQEILRLHRDDFSICVPE